MPVIRCPDGRYRIGKGKCIYKSKKAAMKAIVVILGQNSGNIKVEQNN